MHPPLASTCQAIWRVTRRVCLSRFSILRFRVIGVVLSVCSPVLCSIYCFPPKSLIVHLQTQHVSPPPPRRPAPTALLGTRSNKVDAVITPYATTCLTLVLCGQNLKCATLLLLRSPSTEPLTSKRGMGQSPTQSNEEFRIRVCNLVW